MASPVQLTVLLTGLLPGKSGKTAIALGLIEGLRRRGVKVGYFKPISIFDYYEDYVAVEASLDLGLPVPPEVLSLMEVGFKFDDPCLINPVSVLTAPLKPDTFIEARAPASYFSYAANTFRRAALVRAVVFDPVRTVLAYVNNWAISRNLLRIDYDQLDKLTKRSDHVVKVDMLGSLIETYERISVQALKTAYPKALSRHRVVVVEGVGNTAWPLPPDAEAWVVMAVTHGTVLVYDGKRYKTAVSLKTGGSITYLRRLTTADVFTLLTPSHVVRTPPLHPFEPIESRADKLAGLTDIIVSYLERE